MMTIALIILAVTMVIVVIAAVKVSAQADEMNENYWRDKK